MNRRFIKKYTERQIGPVSQIVDSGYWLQDFLILKLKQSNWKK